MAAASLSSPALIVAAFEPFAGRSRNRSLEVLRRLPAQSGMQTIVLPVDFDRLRPALTSVVEKGPRALLLIGEANRKRVSVEQVALNVLDSHRPDNAGRMVRGMPLMPEAALAMRVHWDALAVAERLKIAGIPAEPSFHAGTYACNAALYLVLQATAQSGTRVGFLHLPRWRWPIGMPLGRLVRAVLLAGEALSPLS